MSETKQQTAAEEPILAVRSLCKSFGSRRSLFGGGAGLVRAVDDVSFDLYAGETLGLVGESGCGKTTLGRCIVRAVDPIEGEVRYTRTDQSLPPADIATMPKSTLKDYRRDIQMIFQDPIASLNPRMTLLEIIGEPMRINGVAEGKELKKRVGELLETVGLRADHMNRYPHAFSGGQRQRVGIARALSLEPEIIVCDEAVSALDVSVQAQILNLLLDIQKTKNLSYLFIAHDLGVVEYICDRVAVMYLGQIVEIAETAALFDKPCHPYTEALMSAVPLPDPDNISTPDKLKGEPGNVMEPPSGCRFHPRCAYATDLCAEKEPVLNSLEDGRKVRCHYAETLDLGWNSKKEVAHA